MEKVKVIYGKHYQIGESVDEQKAYCWRIDNSTILPEHQEIFKKMFDDGVYLLATVSTYSGESVVKIVGFGECTVDDLNDIATEQVLNIFAPICYVKKLDDYTFAL